MNRDESIKCKLYIMYGCILFCIVANLTTFIWRNINENQLRKYNSTIMFVEAEYNSMNNDDKTSEAINNLLNIINDVRIDMVNMLRSNMFDLLSGLIILVVTIIPIGIIKFIYNDTKEYPSFNDNEWIILAIGFGLSIIELIGNIQDYISYIGYYKEIYDNVQSIFNSLDRISFMLFF